MSQERAAGDARSQEYGNRLCTWLQTALCVPWGGSWRPGPMPVLTCSAVVWTWAAAEPSGLGASSTPCYCLVMGRARRDSLRRVSSAEHLGGWSPRTPKRPVIRDAEGCPFLLPAPFLPLFFFFPFFLSKHFRYKQNGEFYKLNPGSGLISLFDFMDCLK